MRTILILIVALTHILTADEPPTEWIDAVTEIAKLPPHASVQTLNADEPLLAGAMTEEEVKPQSDGTLAQPSPSEANKALTFAEEKEVRLNKRLEAHIPMALFTINTKTGELKSLHRSTEWLNHIQFSPTDPALLMFCHEGPWHKVDRVWTIRTDGSGLTKIHTRTINMEIAGHEFFSADGRMIWYDLQTPRSGVFWVAGYNVSTGERIWYLLERSEWSVHFNVSPGGKLFAGDGGGPNSVAAPGNGQWIYLFTAQGGALQAEKLVDLSKHNYRLEPNVTFTPDGKWLVFRSNMFGPTYVFAVE